MGRLLALSLVFVAGAAGAQAGPAAIATKFNSPIYAPLHPRYDTNASGGERFPRLNPSLLKHGSSDTTVCAYCTGHDGGVGWQPR
jgi:hypothetical protein